MRQSKQYQFFLLVGSMLSLANLLVANDWATAWGGSEVQLILDGMYDRDPYFLPALVQSFLTGDLSFHPFLTRLPGVVLLVGCALIFFFWGRRIYGSETITLTLMVWSATLLLPTVGKVATADIWLFFAQLLAWMALLRYLKQPKEEWRILTFTGLLLAVWLQPVSTILYFSLSSWWLFRFHPTGWHLRSVNPWIVLAAAGVALFILDQWQWQNPTYLLTFPSLPYYQFLAIAGLAFLPVIGFFLAGMVDTVQKFRKKEELAIITVAWLIGGLAGQSLLLVAGLGLIVAKQMILYFQPNYPHRNLVRTGAVLHLIAVFCGTVALMLSSFHFFGGVGFRSALAMGAVYWMLSFLSVIGLYGYNRRLIWGGSLYGGVLLSLLFWLQYYPLLENKRNWPQSLASAAQQLELNTEAKLYIHRLPETERDKASLYCDPLFRKIVFTEDAGQLLEFYHNDRGNGFLVPRQDIDQLEVIKDTLALRGWTDGLQELDYVLIRN